ncbi:MAG: cytochrome ubiquinol oxidase subunit I, partial [Propionicimonas sp.]
WNVWISRNSPLVEVDDPWGWGRTLEWATSSPPPRFNFTRLPRIRSESPTFDLNHPGIDDPDYPGKEYLEPAERGELGK